MGGFNYNKFVQGDEDSSISGDGVWIMEFFWGVFLEGRTLTCWSVYGDD